ncbi:naked cuticle-like protein 3 isoform X1 [Etheostoma cragini]|uniref:naked cuticle-like protein 3 isoform X1 n=1 Tax=Etheostoma cragini TaxID=417921 RepID=UPI00155F29D9|nr:naked cuticle-like protein 3 isoform X1 [Etheostoma cragini]
MGKFQSKLASKRRQGPEGGSLASSVLTCQRELERIYKTKLTENLYVELRANKSGRNCNLKVSLPPKKTPNRDKSIHFQFNKRTKKRNSHDCVTECNIVSNEDTQQEWVFTLYNFDNSDEVTREDMSSLIHSMHEVLVASVKPPHGGTTPLKIKLVVTSSAGPEKTSQIAAEKERTTSQEAAKTHYCVDENIERRNHYLDLAGIENYTSKFDNTESPFLEPSRNAHSALKHHPVVIRETGIPPDPTRGHSIPYSQRSKAVSVGKDRNGEEGKSCRLHGQQPASWCHHYQSPPATHSVLQRSQSKRLRSRIQDAASHLRPTPGGGREISSNLQPSYGALASPAQRQEHYHHHEHHHHHHYHPS